MTVERLIQELQTLPQHLTIATCDDDSNECYDQFDIDIVNNVVVMYEACAPKKIEDLEGFEDRDDEA